MIHLVARYDFYGRFAVEPLVGIHDRHGGDHRTVDRIFVHRRVRGVRWEVPEPYDRVMIVGVDQADGDVRPAVLSRRPMVSGMHGKHAALRTGRSRLLGVRAVLLRAIWDLRGVYGARFRVDAKPGVRHFRQIIHDSAVFAQIGVRGGHL